MMDVQMESTCKICGRADNEHRWVSREELVNWSRSQLYHDIQSWCAYLKPLYMIPLSPPENPCDSDFLRSISS